MEYKTAKRMEYLPFSGIRAVMEKATKMQQAGEKVIHLEIGRPDFDTPKKIKDAAYESLNAGHVFYTSNYGTPALRKEIAKWENEHHNVNYETSEVLVTVGVGEATYASMAAFLEEGDEVLVPNPVWLNYIHVPSSLGATPVTYSLKEENDYQIDFEELESKITEKTKMIVVVNPSNPTGGIFSRKTLEKLSEIAIRNDLLVVSDEIYSQLVYDGAEHVSVASIPGMKERTITLGGFSKAYQKETGIAGYTLIYNSWGMILAAHEPFTSTSDAISKESDILSDRILVKRTTQRKTVGETDTGMKLKERIADLQELLEAYRNGLLMERL